MKAIWPLAILGMALAASLARAAGDDWAKLTEIAIGPRVAPALVYSEKLDRFVLIGGVVSHAVKGPRPYHVQSFDLESGQWRNDLPTGAEDLEQADGAAREPGFASPYFVMEDKEGLVRPHPFQCMIGYQFAYETWDGAVYALVCGRTLRYDPDKRTWTNLEPLEGPAPEERSYKETLNWSAMCADPVNREIVLFGGCGVETETASPGTWVYSPDKNTWRKLDLDLEPPPRALAPMVFDGATQKIVLFGGDRLDQLYADTWIYDPATRSWEERTPELSPAPRFGHGLVYLPKSRKVVLLGGKSYTSSTSYQAQLYQPLPFEVWSYDVAANAWGLLQRIDDEEAAPPQPITHPTLAAADADDNVIVLGHEGRFEPVTSTWVRQIGSLEVDADATAAHGVPAGSVTRRDGPYDPDWFHEDVPAPDLAATAKILTDAPKNQWLALECPKWPHNRMGGGWSTTAFDPDNDQILHLGGGHSSYCGNDVAHYDIATGRWSLGYRPQFALNYNYDLSGPGAYAFNLGPWGNHNYHAYGYDPACRRLVYMKQFTQLYDPKQRSWIAAEKFPAPFLVDKYTTYLCPTPRGMVAWTQLAKGASGMGLFRLADGEKWEQLLVEGAELPQTLTDGSTIAYDSKRDRLIMTTTERGNDLKPVGQVWTYDFKTGVVAAANPAAMDAVRAKRFARESVYLPKLDLVMFGFHLDGQQNRIPFYDVSGNRWLAAEIPGSEFFWRENEGIHASVDLGLVYDAKRDLVWGVLCKLVGTGALNVLRLDRETLELSPVE